MERSPSTSSPQGSNFNFNFMAGQTSASSSSSSSFYAPTIAGSSATYDVFLNFRGEDTRKNFTGHLYRALKKEGIHVFIDSSELWEGEVIGPRLLSAIQRSKVSIAVLSTGYADSKWCLMELTQMLDCHRSNHQIVLPIFFDVDPSDVRHQTGSFKKAFLKHEKNMAPDVVVSWKEALREVGNLKGWVLNEVENGDESMLVELVVERALRETSNIFLNDVKYNVGLDSRIKELQTLLNVNSKDVQFIGICGIGGIGKTTIAKALYNCIIKSFRMGCFLSNIREEASGSNGLVSLQEKLIYSISKRKVHGEILDVDRGKQMIEERLHVANALLVLDDVDHPSQLDALAINLNWLGRGSKVVITTRDEDILKVANVDMDKIYWPKELDYFQSLALFSWYAFQQDKPFEKYMALSHYVAMYSGGLPLALEVLGSFLSNVRCETVWECTIEKLRETPPQEVYERLKISYDSLEDHEKNVFLDAGCFFIGWEKETVISIWDACGFYIRSILHKLIKRSLLYFEYNEDGGCYLKMHDQLRDMARRIVSKENFGNPGKHSRLWAHDEILEVLEGNKGSSKIEGIVLPSGLMTTLTSDHFGKMCNLRLLYMNPKGFMVDFPCLPFTLRWFKWSSCPWDIIPTNFYHKRLVHLDLSFTTITEAWNISPQNGNKFEKLKVLNLNNCGSLSKSPNFSWFPCLELLDLGYCRSLKELDESLKQLCQLKSLILQFCDSLQKLPSCIGDLKSLIVLQLNNVTKLEELPASVGRIYKLEVLDVSNCYSLARLPSFSALTNIKRLSLSDCERIRSIDRATFEELDAIGCYNLTRPLNKGLGQGLLLPNMSKELSFYLPDGSWNLFLVIVFDFPLYSENFKFRPRSPLTVYFDISASIRGNDKTASSRCRHTLRIEDVGYITDRDIIYIHHFEGFRWFGIPLLGKEAIENLHIRQSKHLDDLLPKSRVKFWKLLWEKPGRKNPYIGDFFTCLDVLETGADFFTWLDVLETAPSLSTEEEEETVRPRTRARLQGNDDETLNLSLDVDF